MAKQHAESYARPEAWEPRRPKPHSARQQYSGPPAGQSAMEQRQMSGAPRNLSPSRSAAFGAWEEQRDRQVEGAAQNLAVPRTPAFQADPGQLDLQLSDAAQDLTASRSPAFGGKADQPEQHLVCAPRDRTASRLPSFKAMAEQLERQLNYAAQHLSASRSPAFEAAAEHEAGPVNSGEALQPGYQMAQDVIASQVERDAPNKYRGWVTAAAEHEGKSAICPALPSASKLGNLLSTLHRTSSAHISQRENHLGMLHAPLQVHHGIAATMGHASRNAHSCVPDISCMPAMQDRGLMERQGWRVEEVPTVSSTTFSGMQRRHASREMMMRLQTS